MTERKFLNYVFTEGILVLILGLSMLILPKISGLSFGILISTAFIVYGGYKFIISIFLRHFSKHTILDIIMSSVLFITGILLFMAPRFDITLIMGLCGIFFILKSVSVASFSLQTKDILTPTLATVLLSMTELLFGLFIIIMLPTAALWLAGVIAGIEFLLYGLMFINMYITTKYTKSF